MVIERAGSLDAITAAHVFEGARRGDGVAISVARETAKYIGMAIANMASLVDPEIIVLGGAVADARDLLLEPIRQEYARRLPPGLAQKLALCDLGSRRARRRHRRGAAGDGGGLMTVLSGADVVLPDRLLSPGTIVLEGTRITDVTQGSDGRWRRCASRPLQSLHRPRLHRRARARARRARHASGRRRDRRNGATVSAVRRHRVLSDHDCMRTRRASGDARGRQGRQDTTRPRCLRACCRRISKATSSTPNTRARSRSTACARPGARLPKGSSPVRRFSPRLPPPVLTSAS